MRVQINIGTEYGDWTVVAPAGLRGKEAYYSCRCKCGATGEIRKSVLVTAVTGCRQCGAKRRARLHKMTGSFEHNVWIAMRKRCTYAKHPHYALYGGRGITVAPEWDTFVAFYADMGECPYGLQGSIDRIDPDKGYYRGNCQWLLRSEQAKNRRNVPLYMGQTLPVLAKSYGIGESTLRRRIVANWPLELWAKSPKELGTRK